MSSSPPPAPEGARARRRGVAVLLAIWFVSVAALGGALQGRHLLPYRDADPTVARDAALAALRREPLRWTAFHVLYAECGCSTRIVEHLATSARPSDTEEIVVWVGRRVPGLDALERRGFRVVPTLPEALHDELHIESVPLLIALDPAGHARYVGGYSPRKQGTAMADVELLRAARSATPPGPLPLFGCAVSDRLRQLSLL